MTEIRTMSTPNEVVFNLFEQAWNSKNFNNLQDQVALEMKLHLREKTITSGPDQLKEIIENWHKLLPNLKFDIIHSIESDDLVAINCLMKGTPVEEFRGFQANGRKISIPHAFFLRVDNLQIVEVWEINDFSVLETQLS